MSATARHPTHSCHAGTVLARAVTRLLACTARQGLNRRVLMEAANLLEADLANPDGRVRASAHIALWEMIATSVSDLGFGVRAGASLHVRDMGLLGYAMYYSSTVAGALRRLVRYGQLITDELVRRHRGAAAGPHVVLGVSDTGTGMNGNTQRGVRCCARCARHWTLT